MQHAGSHKRGAEGHTPDELDERLPYRDTGAEVDDHLSQGRGRSGLVSPSTTGSGSARMHLVERRTELPEPSMSSGVTLSCRQLITPANSPAAAARSACAIASMEAAVWRRHVSSTAETWRAWTWKPVPASFPLSCGIACKAAAIPSAEATGIVWLFSPAPVRKPPGGPPERSPPDGSVAVALPLAQQRPRPSCHGTPVVLL